MLRRLLCLGAVLATLTLPGRAPLAAQPARAVPCDAFAVSPNFANDRTLACIARRVERPDIGPTGVLFHLSTDGGQSWQLKPAVGLPFAQTSIWLDIAFSLDFARDRLIFVQEDRGGLYSTADAGQSFVAADPLALGGGVRRQLAQVWVPSAVPAVGGPTAALAYKGPTNALIRAPLHVPVSGTVDQLQAFVSMVGPGNTSQVLAISRDSDARLYIHRCTPALSCTTLIEQLAPGQSVEAFSELSLGPAQPAVWLGTRILTASTKLTVQNRLVTPDGKVRRLTALDRLLTSFKSSPERVRFWVTNGRQPRSLVARITLGTLGEAGPSEFLYVSKDLGSTWTLQASSRRRGVFGLPGALPAPAFGSYYYKHAIFSAAGGRLFAIGSPTRDPAATQGAILCSVDHGLKWYESCAK